MCTKVNHSGDSSGGETDFRVIKDQRGAIILIHEIDLNDDTSYESLCILCNG